MKALPVELARVGWRQRLLDFAELCKPRLSSLVLVTVAVGFFAAELSGAALLSSTPHLLGAMFGVALSAAGAATLNQFLERDLDARMERTRDRPLPSGRMSPELAFVFGITCVIAGSVLLDVFTNRLAAGLGLLSAGLYVCVYTPLKRVTTFNTLVGAVVGALPPMIGWVAATGGIEAGAWLLFTIVFIWQMPHFFAIAWFYREDYGRAGMRMISVGDTDGRFTMQQILLFSVTMVPVSLMPAMAGLAGGLYFWTALALGLGLVALGVRLMKLKTQAEARRLFLGSLVYLPCLLGLLLADIAFVIR